MASVGASPLVVLYDQIMDTGEGKKINQKERLETEILPTGSFLMGNEDVLIFHLMSKCYQFQK